MAVQVAVPSTRRVSHRVADMMYAADVSVDGHTTVDIPACVAAGAGVLANGVVLAAAGNVAPTVVQTDFIMGRYGRNVTISGGTGTGVIVGYDYLGQGIAREYRTRCWSCCW